MRSLKGALAGGALLALAGGAQQVGAAKWPTYHIHHVYLTPIAASIAHTLSYEPAKAGVKYLVVRFSEVNKDDVQAEYAYNDIKVVTPDGKTIEQSFASPDDNLGQDVLDPGGHTTGSVAWEVPQTAHTAELRWNPTSGFTQAKMPTYTWKVSF